MPKFRVEVYELHVSTTVVTAENAAEAIATADRGGGYTEDNSPEYLETADEYGMAVEGNEELAAALSEIGRVVVKLVVIHKGEAVIAG